MASDNRCFSFGFISSSLNRGKSGAVARGYGEDQYHYGPHANGLQLHRQTPRVANANEEVLHAA
jgi:hypothetical protein